MGKFAKLFDLEGGEQVLAKAPVYNENDESYGVAVETDYDGINVRMTVSFKDEGKADDFFDEYSMDKAIAFREEVESNFNG